MINQLLKHKFFIFKMPPPIIPYFQSGKTSQFNKEKEMRSEFAKINDWLRIKS